MSNPKANLGRKFPTTWRRHMSDARRPVVRREMDASERGYLAGIIDGEGTIALYPRKSRTVSLQLKVTNTDIAVLQWIEDRLGGKVSPNRARSVKHKPTFTYYALAERAGLALRLAMPRLIIKRNQAILALDFLERRFESENLADWMRTEMKRMNRRGM